MKKGIKFGSLLPVIAFLLGASALRAQASSGVSVPIRIWAEGTSATNAGMSFTYTLENLVGGYTYYKDPIFQTTPDGWFYEKFVGYGPAWGADPSMGTRYFSEPYIYYCKQQITKTVVGSIALSGSFMASAPNASDGYASASTSTQVANQVLSLSLGINGIVRAEPGKSYLLSAGGTGLSRGSFYVAAPPQYRVLINGVERTAYGLAGQVTLCLVPRNEGPPGAAGFASGIRSDRLDWRLPLGTLRNGDDAGSVRIVDAGLGADWNELFTPGALNCEPTSDEVYVFRQNNIIRQIIANQVAIDVVVPEESQNTFKLLCYSPSQMQSTTLPCTFSGDPFVTYTVQQSTDSGDPITALKITREFRNTPDSALVTRTETTKLVRTGTYPNFSWTRQDWHSGSTVLQEATSTIAASVDSTGGVRSRTETIVVRVPGSSPTITGTRTYSNFAFGEGLASETLGSSSPKTARFGYYSDLSQAGSFGFVESVQLAGGQWQAFDYCDSDKAMSYQGGRIKAVYRPFGPAAPAVPTKDPAQGEVTTYSYGPDPFGSNTRVTLVQTAINGTVTAKSTTAYDSVATSGLITATRNDYAGTSATQTTVTQYYSEASTDAFIRGKPVSVCGPDGVTTNYTYEKGAWNSGVFSVGASPNNASRITASKLGQGGAVNGESTRVVTIRDSRALVARTESYVWSGGAWALVTWTNYTYNMAGLLTGSTSSDGTTYAATWDGPLKTSETDAFGVKTDYTYDAAGRVATATRSGATSGTTTIAALSTGYVYDAAGQVLQTRVGPASGESLLTTVTYDDAGRLSSETKPGLGTTTHAYDPVARTHTTTRPDGSTVIDAQNIDGSAASQTGTGVVAQYFSYGVDATDGRRWSQVNVASPNSARWTKTWTDWLGRKVQTRKPGFTGQPDYETATLYDSGGRVWRTTSSGIAATLYQYDSMSKLIRSGLDVNGDNFLSPASNDRITDMEEVFEQSPSSGTWWLTKRQWVYPYENSGSRVLISGTSTNLTLGSTGGTSFLASEVNSSDYFGNVVTTRITADTATKVAEKRTTRGATYESETALMGFPISRRSFEGVTDTFTYDALGRQMGIVDPRTGTTTTTYRPNTALPQQVVDPAGKRLAWTEYDLLGRPIFTKDAYDYTTRTAYTYRGEVAQVWGSGTYPVSYGYDEFGEKTLMRTYQDPSDVALADSTTFPNVGTGNDTTWDYDAPSGLLKRKADAKLGTVEYDYDVAGRLLNRYWGRTLPGASARVQTTYSYIPQTGDQNAIKYNDGTPWSEYFYNRLGQNTEVQQHYPNSVITTDLGWSIAGYIATEYLDGTFFGGRQMARRWDGTTNGYLGRVGGHYLKAGNLAEQSIGVEYDTATTRVMSVWQNGCIGIGLEHLYSYVPNSTLIAGTALLNNPFSTTRTYEANRDLLTSIEAKWSTTSRTKYAYTYDDRRLRSSMTQSGDVFADYGGPSGGAIHENFAYNGRGELTQAGTWLGDRSAGEVDALSGRRHEFGYDGIGNRRWSNTSGVSSLRDNYVVNELNQYVSRENNTLPVGGSVANDPAIKVAAGTSPLVAAGRHGRHWGDNMLVDNLGGPFMGPVKFFAAKAGGGAGGVDLFSVNTRTAFIPPAFQTFAYDADGNMLSDGVWNYTWDAENRLIAMETKPEVVDFIGQANVRRLEFKYDYLGRRIEKLVRAGWNGSAYTSVATQRRFIYNGWNLIAEYSVAPGTNSLTLVRSYTWGLDVSGSLSAAGGVGALLQIADHSLGKVFFTSYDGNGNLAALFDYNPSGSGTCVAAYEYSPYGELLRCEGTYAAVNPFRFSTKYFDAESGLYDYGRRYYNPRDGRFVGRDPIEEKGGRHLYAFCLNNPINRWDRLGMDPGETAALLEGLYAQLQQLRDWMDLVLSDVQNAYVEEGTSQGQIDALAQQIATVEQQIADLENRPPDKTKPPSLFNIDMSLGGSGVTLTPDGQAAAGGGPDGGYSGSGFAFNYSLVNGFGLNGTSLIPSGVTAAALNNPATGAQVSIGGYGNLTITNYASYFNGNPVEEAPNGVVHAKLAMTFTPTNGQAPTDFIWIQWITNDPYATLVNPSKSTPRLDSIDPSGAFTFPSGKYNNGTPVYTNGSLNFYDHPENPVGYPISFTTFLVDKTTGRILQQVNWGLPADPNAPPPQ